MGKQAGGSFFKGFLIGGAIGAATAFLMAPQSGEETRTQIRERSMEIRNQAESTYADVQKRIEKAASDLRMGMDELSHKMDEVIVRARADLAQKAADVAEEVAPEEGAPKERP